MEYYIDYIELIFNFTKNDTHLIISKSEILFGCCMLLSTVGCPTGEMYDDKMKGCVMCPLGTYQNDTYQMTCKQCPGKHSTKFNGSKVESDCIRMT